MAMTEANGCLKNPTMKTPANAQKETSGVAKKKHFCRKSPTFVLPRLATSKVILFLMSGK
jgi:hypothetical protein